VRARSNSQSEAGAGLPLLALLFAICFALGFGGVYLARHNRGDDRIVALPGPDTTTAVETTIAPDTSLVLETTLPPPSTEAPDTTVAVTDPPTTEAPTTTEAVVTTTKPAPGPAPEIGTQGAFMAPPGDVQVRIGGPEQGCDSLTISGSARDCAAFESSGTRWAWVIESSGVLEVLRSDLQPDGSSQWPVVLRSRADVGSVRIVDVDGDGSVDLVASRGGQGQVNTDIVQFRNGQPVTTLHLEFAGRVIVSDGQIDLWADRADGPQEHFVVRSEGGAWMVVA
jgi:hypothetical protein